MLLVCYFLASSALLDTPHTDKKGLIATLAIIIVNGLVHSAHFVLGCCDVHLRRHAGISKHYNHRKEGIEISKA
ncbi:uncharacterized protein N7498_000158 [Penicillium cinerascens]|uniref:Uncharacterized protein n=1 Tax=Penicillium cinerascens TaxID=70096 RepID=A0A9W9TD53_9EURO|nr:uncharacterized protein N7498_000158 [Penicillium cinerascens]KAJ5218059.1 hypothetical protein N7498_000158 [Penicillium cinerascens]